MTTASKTVSSTVSIDEMKKRVTDFNNSFLSNEITVDQMQDTLDKMSVVASNKQFLSDDFLKVLNAEIIALEKKIKVDTVDAAIKFFVEVAHYVWTHPEKEEKLIIKTKVQYSYPSQELAYSFSGELGSLLESSMIPFNQFGLVWLVDYKNKKQKLTNTSSWENFSDFFVKNFCDDPKAFAKAFKAVVV